VVIALFALLKASNNLTESVAASTLLKQREAKAYKKVHVPRYKSRKSDDDFFSDRDPDL
jgi:hypothetical protein